MRAARSDSSAMRRRSCAEFLGVGRGRLARRASRSSSWSNCAYPITLVSGLFSSCATPATSCPIADSFSAWSSCAWVDFSRSTVASELARWPARARRSSAACRRAPRMSSVTFFATCTTDGAVGAAEDREGRHAEDLPVRTRHLGAAAAGRERATDRAVPARWVAEADLDAGRAAEAAHVAPEVRRERGVAAKQAAAAVEDRDRIARSRRTCAPTPACRAGRHRGAARSEPPPGFGRRQSPRIFDRRARSAAASRTRATASRSGRRRPSSARSPRSAPGVGGPARRQPVAHVVDDVRVRWR